ncbi:hypothetical protein [Fibrella aquatilis]|uniref:Uncharacterized protein n=1 Tax=Fibrella aquatilis TaxID=2817059 RepID=A0A939GD78_9BACT|nr:hypothetical protein [Fibrella aquatilis]MBO0934427.1 hypothetical protein [Fibrella aquatilis]
MSAFGGGQSVLAELHLLCIALVAAQYWIGNQHLLRWAALAITLGLAAGYWLAIPGSLMWFPSLYLLKAVLFDKTTHRVNTRQRTYNPPVGGSLPPPTY